MPSTVAERMANIRTKDTAPELELRRLLSREGVRYRLHRRDLPGSPDVYVSRLRLAIFVHGCFWHGHDCRRGSRPKSNVEFWNAKIAKNQARDRRVICELKTLGIDTMELWTCRPGDFQRSSEMIGRLYRGSNDGRATA